MNPNEWKHEMNLMLDSFASQAECSLRKINRCFEALGQPFDDDFRKYYLDMSNQRLDMSFRTVLFSKGLGRRNETENCMNNPNSTQNQPENDGDDDNHFDTRTDQSSNEMRHSAVAGCGNDANPFLEAEINRGTVDNSAAMIEIYDSDDDDNERPFETQTNADVNGGLAEINENVASAMQDVPKTNRKDIEIGVADLDSENEVKPFVKVESNANNAIEMVDIPLIEFDPNKENDCINAGNGKSESGKSQQMDSSSNRKNNESKCSVDDKRLKCEHCDSFFYFKSYLKRHQPVHANGKFIGVKADSNGLYHCSHCVRKFITVGNLSRHMKLHKNNQHLHYCVRCMRLFDQQAKKERHERQCEGHHFECHLCKVYMTRNKAHLQIHMRKHSGARSFRCMVCSKSFQEKEHLRRHLISIHSRN